MHHTSELIITAQVMFEQNKKVIFTQAVIKTLGIHGIKSNLEKFEIPRMMSLAPEVNALSF